MTSIASANQLIHAIKTTADEDYQDMPQRSERLAELLSPFLNTSQIARIQNDLQNMPDDVIDAAVSNARMWDSSWPGFEEFVKSYLRLLRDYDPFDTSASFDLISQSYIDLQTAFSSARGTNLNHLAAAWSHSVVKLAFELDGDDTEKLRCAYVANPLLRIFNSARTERNDNPNATLPPFSKKAIILFVADLLCRLYFHIGQPTSCANVFSNMSTANIKMSIYPKAQQVEYRFYLGRFYLTKGQLRNAYMHLKWAFDTCLAQSQNKRLILKYLVPCSMLLGITPTQELLQYYALHDVYWPLVTSLKQGNHGMFFAALEQRRDWMVDRQLYVLLQSRAPILLNRSCNKHIHAWTVAQGMPAVDYGTIQRGLNMSRDPNSLVETPAQVEAILVALIDQGFIKGKLQATGQKLIYRKSEVFPQICVILRARQALLKLIEDEQWMDR